MTDDIKILYQEIILKYKRKNQQLLWTELCPPSQSYLPASPKFIGGHHG